MTDVTQLARTGDPRAIAALLNRSLQSKGFTVQAALNGNCLKILLESAQVPDQASSVKFIRSGMKRLAPEGIETVKLYGKRSGEVKPEWEERIKLARSGVEMEKPAPVDGKPKATVIAQRDKDQQRSTKPKVVLFWWSQQSPFQKFLSIVVSLCLGLYILLQFFGPSSNSGATLPSEDPTLPPHTVSQSSLGGGDRKRIQVDANNSQLTHDECSNLASRYSPYAGSGGQVVVQKPSVSPPWNGKLMPFCLDNMEGEGITFSDFNFR